MGAGGWIMAWRLDPNGNVTSVLENFQRAPNWVRQRLMRLSTVAQFSAPERPNRAAIGVGNWISGCRKAQPRCQENRESREKRHRFP